MGYLIECLFKICIYNINSATYMYCNSNASVQSSKICNSWVTVERPFRKPNCLFVNKLFETRCSMILSVFLQSIQVKLTGLMGEREQRSPNPWQKSFDRFQTSQNTFLCRPTNTLIFSVHCDVVDCSTELIVRLSTSTSCISQLVPEMIDGLQFTAGDTAVYRQNGALSCTH